MNNIIDHYKITYPLEGPAGLSITHLDKGELLEACFCSSSGLRIRAEKGSVWVKIDLPSMREHWSGESFIQILEASNSRQELCWLVPLAGDCVKMCGSSST